MQPTEERELRRFAAQIRLKTVEQFRARGFGHVGGAMSIVETLSVLYGKQMNYRPEEPDFAERDYFVLSKGHAGPALYAVLALKGFFPEGELKTLNQNGTRLPSHCDRQKTIGVDMTTGSLGQGVSTAIGVALGQRMRGEESYTYLMIGDGECNEGQVWEGIMFAAQWKLSNLILFVDQNKMQLDGPTSELMDLGDLRRKLEDFGFFALTVDGHDVTAIDDAITKGKAQQEKPVAIVLDTVKGKGFTGLEGPVSNHHVELKTEQLDVAEAAILAELARWEGKA